MGIDDSEQIANQSAKCIDIDAVDLIFVQLQRDLSVKSKVRSSVERRSNTNLLVFFRSDTLLGTDHVQRR